MNSKESLQNLKDLIFQHARDMDMHRFTRIGYKREIENRWRSQADDLHKTVDALLPVLLQELEPKQESVNTDQKKITKTRRKPSLEN